MNFMNHNFLTAIEFCLKMVKIFATLRMEKKYNSEYSDA